MKEKSKTPKAKAKKSPAKPKKSVSKTVSAKKSPSRSVKKPVKSVKKDSTAALMEKLSEVQPAPQTTTKASNRKMTIFFVIALVAFGLYIFKDKYIAAVVNGQPIPRYALHMELEKQSGRQALDGMITKAVVVQEAKKQNVEVTQEEIDAQLTEIEDSLQAQGQTLEDVIALQGLTREDVIEQIQLQLMIEKIVGQDVEVSDEEVDAYLEDNKEALPEDANMEELKVTVKENLKQQQLNAKVQDWIQELRDKAVINNYLFPESEEMSIQ